MRPHMPRDTPAVEASSLPAQCKPISASVKLCPADVIAIAAVALFICYIIWGIPPTIRAIRSLHAKLSPRRKRRDIRVHLTDDLEKGMDESTSSDPDSKLVDPYLGPTKLLRSFLLNGKVALPERAYKSHGQDTAETRKERERLGRFRFPEASPTPSPSPLSPTIIQSPYEPSTSGHYSAPSVPHVVEREEPLSPFSASFPAPPGLTCPAALRSPELDVAERLDPLPPMPPTTCLSPSVGDGMKPVCKPCNW